MDYASHIAHTFMVTPGTKEGERPGYTMLHVVNCFPEIMTDYLNEKILYRAVYLTVYQSAFSYKQRLNRGSPVKQNPLLYQCKKWLNTESCSTLFVVVAEVVSVLASIPKCIFHYVLYIRVILLINGKLDVL